MKNILLFCYILLQSALANAQTSMPSYPEVMKHFLTNYSYERQEPYDKLSLAKKKDGWYVTILDQLNKDSVKHEQLFWSLRESRYRPLNGFGMGIAEEEAIKELEKIIYENSGPLVYGYERCRYYGYNTWDVDMIRDFGNVQQPGDTLLEGLGRAYAYYAERYLWYNLGGYPFDDDPLKKPLKTLGLPGKERINHFMFYINKSIGCYQQLYKQNPGFKTLIGTPRVKQLNEEFHQYQQLLIAGYEKEAKAVLDRVEKNNFLYQQMGHAYLDACPLNAILITYGDNDTYPLWYVQEKEGFRKDVTVLNNSLLGFAPYINMLKKKHPDLFTTNPELFGDRDYSYFVFDPENPEKADDTLSLTTLLLELQTVRYPIARTIGTVASYRSKNIALPADTQRLKKIATQSNLTTHMNIKLGDYLLLNELMLLDILNTNLHSRPVCFTVNGGFFSETSLQEEGPVYRLLPLENSLPAAKLAAEIEQKEAFLDKHPSPVMAAYTGPKPYYESVLYNLHTNLYSGLISRYTTLGNEQKARQWVDRYLADPVIKKVVADVGDFQMAETLLNAGYLKEAAIVAERLATSLYFRYKNHSAVEFYPLKENYPAMIRYLADILSKKSITVPALESIIEDIEKEKGRK